MQSQNLRKISYLDQQNMLYGTTIFVGQVTLHTIYGQFVAYTYQDLIHKGYIIACTYGNLKQAKSIYIRMHSSCVTSQHLRSMDCDCVQQMEGTFKKISQKGAGILFYLIQQGRGCGYILKSKGCQITQYHQNDHQPIDTFESYKLMGLIPDYRDYRSIRDISELLNIKDKQYILITNNPDKKNGFQKLGLKLVACQSIEFKPGPFNCDYLKSKQEFGHILIETKKKVPKYKIPYQLKKPFVAYSLPKLQRFIHVSSYYLPIKPVNNQLYFTQEQLYQLKNKLSQQQLASLSIQKHGQRYFIKFKDQQLISKYSQLTTKPYWFCSNVYYDFGSSLDFIVLTHNYNINQNSNIVPIIRIQSQSIFDRFPLKDPTHKKRYLFTIQNIVKRGQGIIIILYKDGRGSGLAHKIFNTQKRQHGMNDDSRDFDAALKLLKFYIGDKAIQLYTGSNSYIILKPGLNSFNIKVQKCHIFENEHNESFNQELGHRSLYNRIQALPQYLQQTYKCFQAHQWSPLDPNVPTYTTGIGSSESHARYLAHLIPSIIFKPPQILTKMTIKIGSKLICYSQGLSPNINIILSKFNHSNITLITTINKLSKNTDRQKRLIDLQKMGVKIINYPQQIPDNTLIRILGPTAGYLSAISYHNYLNKLHQPLNLHLQKPSDSLIQSIQNIGTFVIIVNSQLCSLLNNIKMKFIEGSFQAQPIICDYISFPHGYFQYAFHHKCPIICFGSISNQIKSTIQNTFYYEVVNFNPSFAIIEIEHFVNYIALHSITEHSINQIDWPGKQSQKIMYERTQ